MLSRVSMFLCVPLFLCAHYQISKNVCQRGINLNRERKTRECVCVEAGRRELCVCMYKKASPFPNFAVSSFSTALADAGYVFFMFVVRVCKSFPHPVLV